MKISVIIQEQKKFKFFKTSKFFLFLKTFENFIKQVEKDKAVNSTDAGPKSGWKKRTGSDDARNQSPRGG